MWNARTIAIVMAAGFWLAAPLARGESAAAPGLKHLKGPYLQRVTTNSVVIMWETDRPAAGAVDFAPANQPGRQAGDAAPRKIHEITLSGLAPETVYRYRVISREGTNELASAEESFSTAPVTPRAWRFAVYGDSRSNPAVHRSIADLLLKDKEGLPALLLHTGDLVGSGREYAQWGNEFFGPARELLARVGVWPCLGNHEDNADWYFQFFALPNNERWYSFDYLNAHFIVLDVWFGDCTPGSDQYNWLVNDLQATRADWIVACFHAPPFSSGPHCQVNPQGIPHEKEVENVRQWLVPLFQDYGVDLAFCGHDHFYERSRKENVYYLVAGSAGAGLYGRGDWDGNVTQSNQYSQVFKQAHHYMVCDLDQRHLRLRAWDMKGQLLDELEISKPAARGAPAKSSTGIAGKPAAIEQTANLALRLKFDEGEGAVAWDSGPNQYRAVIRNGKWEQGKKGKAIYLRDGYISVIRPRSVAKSVPLASAQGITFLAWIKLAELKEATLLLARYPQELAITPTGLAWAYPVAGQEAGVGASAPFNFKPDQWYHVAVTHDFAGKQVACYVDGERVAQQEVPVCAPENITDLTIGYFSTWYPQKAFHGALDDLKIFNRALNADEIKKQM